MSEEDQDTVHPNLGLAVSETLVSDETTQAFATLADTGIDLAIHQGAFDGVPVLGILTGVLKAGRKIKDEIEYRNIVRFLLGLSDTSQKERERFVAKRLEEDSLSDFGENILLLLERVDDVKKPEMIGRLMAACIQGHLSYSDAMRLAAVVNRSYFSDLLILHENRDDLGSLNKDVQAALFSVGLMKSQGLFSGSEKDPEAGGVGYAINSYGELLLRYGWSSA
ncbi:MAG: hypothetical protein MRY81_11385 [Donghicola eburneus]|jgi:hypothetical protein|nr:hypothetical protein [Donghicola eburneus]MCI5040275.1 hypothetical protein [Donghicola eburneus]